MDLTPSHPSPADDAPLGEQPPAQTAEPDTDTDADADAETGTAGAEAVVVGAGTAVGVAAGTAGAATGTSAAAGAGTGTGTRVGKGTPSRVGREIGGKKFRVGTGDDYVPFRSRTKRRRRTIAAGAVCLVLLGAGAYGIVSLVGSPSQPSVAGSCTASGTGAAVGHPASAQLPTAGQIKLNVYNSTDRHGLAASTANVLKQRGFAIGKVTNDPLKANLAVAAQIRGGSASSSAMRVVAAEVAGSELQPDTRTDGSVDLVLGTGFTALASPDQVSAALKAAPVVAAAKGSGSCG